jgi:hypothetical protein
MNEQNVETNEPYAGWAILELMGHRKLAGNISFVLGLLRIDIPCEPAVTQFYGMPAIYCFTPTTEEIARGLAAKINTAPVSRYELPAAPSAWAGRCCAGCRGVFTAADAVVLLPSGDGMHTYCYAEEGRDPDDEDVVLDI